MGWDFKHGATKQDTINELIKGYDGEKQNRVCIMHSVRGNVLWTVWSIINKTTHETTWLIGCDLLSSQKNYGWGYKSMSEDMHPYYYTCPLKYLDIVPVACQEWRDKVIKLAKERAVLSKKTFSLGEIIKLKGCKIPEVTVLSVKPLIGESSDGRKYKIPKRMIDMETV